MEKPAKPIVMIAMLCLFLSFSSCNKEELFVEQKRQVVEEAPVEEDKDKDTSVNTSLPCDFSLSNITANSTVVINCVLNLGGNSITLPDNVDIQFEGGEINNGKLVFSGGTIAGDLLNISLGIEGDVALKSNNFTFYPEKWNIIEGKTTKEISLKNREHINKSIELVKRLGGEIFEVGKLDAYFNVEANKVNRLYCTNRSIRIPSDFHFKMSQETFLRVQPTHFPAYALITTYATDNSNISGGNLIGDRWEHDYSPINDIVGANRDEHGYGHLIWVIGSHNLILDNIKISLAIGEGIQVHSKTIRKADGSLGVYNKTSENIIIKNCIVFECRRNNIAIVDASGVIIENCDIKDTGSGKQAYDTSGNKIFSSAGTAPRYGVDLEALRYINDDGTMNEINKIDNVVIRNSRFTGNAAGDIDIYTVTNVIIEGNYFDKWVANFAANDIIIRNNTFESRDPNITFGINIKSFMRNNIEFNYNYQITGNTIKGYKNGITIAGKNHKVKDNRITNCEIGIQLKGRFYDSTFSGNVIKSDLPASFGYKNFSNSQNINNIQISNDLIDVTNRPIGLIGFNSESSLNEIQMVFDNCTLNTKNNSNFFIHVNNGKNIEFKNNTSNTDFEVLNSKNIVFTNNSINQ